MVSKFYFILVFLLFTTVKLMFCFTKNPASIEFCAIVIADLFWAPRTSYSPLILIYTLKWSVSWILFLQKICVIITDNLYALCKISRNKFFFSIFEFCGPNIHKKSIVASRTQTSWRLVLFIILAIFLNSLVN